VERRRQELGLDRSWPAQYAEWLGGALRLDAGRSLTTGAPVLEAMWPRVAVTLELTLFSLLIAVSAGLAGGLAAARWAGRLPDIVLRAAAMLLLSAPAFWLGLLLIVGVATWTGHFLVGGYEPLASSPGQNLGAVLPAAGVLALRPAALLLRVVRTSTLESGGSQFFLFARSKGLNEGRALTAHAFRAAMLPAVTVIGAQAVFMLGGAVAIEQVFALPGIGRALVQAVLARDYPSVQALVLLFGIAAIAINLLLDFVYVRLDPRVRLAG
jgi:peptide/nickel transport system permease protein